MNQATQKVSFELFHFFNQKSKLFLNSKRNLFVSSWLVFQGSDSLAYYLSFTLENVNFSMISIINWDGVEDRPCNLIFLCMYNVNWVVSCTFIALERKKMTRVKCTVGTWTCSAVSNRSMNLETRHLPPRTCEPVRPKSSPVLHGTVRPGFATVTPDCYSNTVLFSPFLIYFGWIFKKS